MTLILHLIIVFTSIIFSTITVFSPTYRKIQYNYVLVFGVIASGVVLTLEKPSHLAQSCLSGILYLSIVMFSLVAAKRRLATESAHENS